MKKHKTSWFSLLVFLTIVGAAGDALPQRKTPRTRPSPRIDPKVLSRARAADLIKVHPRFKEIASSSLIPVGTFWYDYRSVDDFKNNVQVLQDNELVTFRETGQSNSVWWHQYVVELTPSGDKEAKMWTRASDQETLHWLQPFGFGPQSPDVVTFTIPLANKQLLEVTGIATDPGGKLARVEFTWSWTPRPEAKAMSNRVPSNEAHNGQVWCQLYDDGWRMGEMLL